jgi:hypothetical protein
MTGVGAARKHHACPECGRLSARIASAFAIVAGGSDMRDTRSENGMEKLAARVKPKGLPLCLQSPHIPLLCHMDEPSGRRLVAHYNGRGAEYDDKMAGREELRKKRGLPPAATSEPSGHDGHEHSSRRHQLGTGPASGGGHGHAHTHSHSAAHNHQH